MSDFDEQLLSLIQSWNQTEFCSTSAPMIDNAPTDSNKLNALCSQLLNEGKLHQQPYWAAHMTAPISVSSMAGQLLAAMHHGNLLSAEIYPLLVQIEQQLLNWFCRQFYQQHGHFTHGSTYANLEALWHARDRSAQGLRKVYGSQAVHYSVIKACQILGLDFQSIETDPFDRMLPHALNDACRDSPPVAIVLNAGTTGCGSLDPLSELVPVAKQFNAWCHVDAAWGGFLALLPEYQNYFEQLSQVDSVCFDPHKGLSQPRPCGLLMYQTPLAKLDAETSYLNRSVEKSVPGSYGGELFLPLWLYLHSQGLQQVQHQLRGRLQQAKLFADFLHQKNMLQLCSETGVVCFKPSQQKLAKLVENNIISTTKLNGDTVYRAVFASNNTRSEALITALAPYL